MYQWHHKVSLSVCCICFKMMPSGSICVVVVHHYFFFCDCVINHCGCMYMYENFLPMCQLMDICVASMPCYYCCKAAMNIMVCLSFESVFLFPRKIPKCDLIIWYVYFNFLRNLCIAFPFVAVRTLPTNAQVVLQTLLLLVICCLLMVAIFKVWGDNPHCSLLHFLMISDIYDQIVSCVS